MKMIKNTLALLIVFSLLCLTAAYAEDLYWDNTTRIPNLYEEKTLTFNKYFSLTIPENWNLAEISEADSANGIIAVTADDLDNPKLKLTVSYYTPEECTNVFGGTGYDAIYAYLSNNHADLASVRINDVWTMLYSAQDGGKMIVVLNMTSSDGYMYQARFDVSSITTLDILNNIIKSCQYAQ